MKSEVQNLNIAVELLGTEIFRAKPQPPKASSTEASSSVTGLAISQATHSNESESSVRRNRTYTFDEPITFTPLSPPPRRKPVTRARSTATL